MAVTRRQLLKMTGIGSAGVAATSLGALGFDLAFARERALKYKLDDTKATPSICPYCAVGCGTLVQTRDDASGHPQIVNIEGNPDSPISTGSLCPKGAATFQLVAGDHRLHHCLYRPSRGKEWQLIPLERAMEMVAERVRDSRERTWEQKDERKNDVQRTLGIAHLGGATLDNEENYLLKKLYTALGIVQVENQARI